jgi:predicted ATPase
MSQSVRELLDTSFVLKDLGEHRLKDFAEPVALLQLGDRSFPPLKTIVNTNLPRPASSFIGRESEVREVVALVRGGARFVTLDGPGGSGKTRLAIEAASELVGSFKAGVFWVGLAGLNESSLVLAEVAQTLGAHEELASHIAEREMLLLLDNFEQVVDAAPELAGLVEACPNLRVLVTSRELLRVRGEVRYEVPPLEPSAAVALFCARAQLDESSEVVELCRRLDNLPLALELAAARTAVLDPGKILERISQRLDLLRGGRDMDPRQQTLRTTIEWSYGLLAEHERRLFARLACFAGGCTLEAAEEVAGADLDTLQSLVEKSLLRRANERFWMLETIREYSLERLAESEESERLRQAHASFFLSLAETADPELQAGAQRDWLARLEQENGNLRAALSFLASSPEHDLGLRLAVAVVRFWDIRGYFAEGRQWLDRGLERASGRPTTLRARALGAAALMAGRLGDSGRARACHDQRLTIGRALGDNTLIASALHGLGVVDSHDGSYERAASYLKEAQTLFQKLGDARGARMAIGALGILELNRGDYKRAEEFLEQAVALSQEATDEWSYAGLLGWLGLAALEQSQSARARELWHKGLEVAACLDAKQLVGYFLMTAAALEDGDPSCAARLLGAAAALQEDAGYSLDELPALRAVHERTLAGMQECLDPEAFESFWREGVAMSADKAVAYALEGPLRRIPAARQG